jgi:hypothetical protein
MTPKKLPRRNYHPPPVLPLLHDHDHHDTT